MVYDLEVPEEQSFLANGILVHNSTSWVMYGKYGLILVPRTLDGVYRYDESPYTYAISARSKAIGSNSHFHNRPGIEKERALDYFSQHGFIMGKSECKTVGSNSYELKDGEKWIDKKKNEVEVVMEEGLCNNYELRDKLNLIYFLDLEKNQKEWPWPWLPNIKIDGVTYGRREPLF
jgi:intein/homing endonuclease